MRIGDLVEHQHDALLRQRIDVGRGQRIGLSQQPLVDGVRPEPLVDQVRADDFRRHPRVDIFVRQPPRGVFGDEELSDMAPGIGERGRNRVPAIENRRPVRACLAVAPGRPSGRFTPFFEGFTAGTPERRFSVTIAHKRLVSRVPDSGNLGASGGYFAACIG